MRMILLIPHSLVSKIVIMASTSFPQNLYYTLIQAANSCVTSAFPEYARQNHVAGGS